MALDPNIALGVRGIELPNPLTQYSQMAQIQNAQNQNQLAQYQLGAAQRQEFTQNALSDAYKAAYNSQTGAIDSAMLMRGLAERGAGHLIPDVQTKMLATEKERGAIKKTAVETTGLEFKQRIDKATKAIGDIAALNSPEEAIASIDQHLASGDIDQQKANMLKGQLAQAPSFGAWQKGMLVNILDAKERLTQTSPKPMQVTRADGSIIFLDQNPNSPTFQKEVMPAQASGMTPAQIAANRIAQQQANISAGNLALQQAKFAFEKANPGFELKENENGEFFGVNKRTLQAFPVTIGGGAAPAVAPMVQGAGGMPGPRMAQPGAVVPAIPGMTSVLDQTAPAVAPTAGGPRQLVGKGTAMTEAQSKSAMFGAAMNQANGIISKVEKDGTTTAPVAVSVLQGLAKLSPQFLGSGENAANAIESIFRQDPTSLLGPDVNQQKLGQAQIAFATAYLRATSGAAFGPSEVSNTIKEYFPLVGEDKTVVQQKAKARQRAIEGMKISTSKQGQSYIDKSGANANDPLELFGGKP